MAESPAIHIVYEGGNVNGHTLFENLMVHHYLALAGVSRMELGLPAANAEADYLEANLELAKSGFFRDMQLSVAAIATPYNIKAAAQNERVENITLYLRAPEEIKRALEKISHERFRNVDLVITGMQPPSSGYDGYLKKIEQASAKRGIRVMCSYELNGNNPTESYDAMKKFAEEVNTAVVLRYSGHIADARHNLAMGAMGVIKAGSNAYVSVRAVSSNGEMPSPKRASPYANLGGNLMGIIYSQWLSNRAPLDKRINPSAFGDVVDYASKPKGSDAPRFRSASERKRQTGRALEGLGLNADRRILSLAERVASQLGRELVIPDEIKFIAEHPGAVELVLPRQ